MHVPKSTDTPKWVVTSTAPAAPSPKPPAPKPPCTHGHTWIVLDSDNIVMIEKAQQAINGEKS